jgi:hypothetical protein
MDERAPICDVPDDQAVLWRRRQARRPPHAKIRPAGGTNAMSAVVLVLPTTPLALIVNPAVTE